MGFSDRLVLAADYVKQAKFGAAAKSLINPGEYRGAHVENLTGEPSIFYDFSSSYDYRHFNVSDRNDCLTAYMKCSPISAIIGKKGQAYINGKTWVMKTQGKGKDREATSPVANKLRKLMAKPNPKQTWKQFEAENYMLTQLFGYCIVYIQKPYGFPNYEAEALWNIPPHICMVDEKQGLFYKDKGNGIEKLRIAYGGEWSEIDAESLFVFKDVQLTLDSMYFPESRIKTLEMPINNAIGAYESRNTLINSRGALGMISNQGQDASSVVPLKAGEKEEIHRDFKKMHGLRRGQTHVIITNANVKWQSMVASTKDLMLFEEVEADIEQMCDTYGYPFSLLSRGKGTTFSNMSSANIMLYQDAIIPEADTMYEQWNSLFELDKYDIALEKDYSKVSALQSARKQEAEATLRMNQANQIAFRNDIITKNMWLISIGEDPIDDGDVYYSAIKNEIGDAVNNDNTQNQDNINPREQQNGNPANDGTTGQQA